MEGFAAESAVPRFSPCVGLARGVDAAALRLSLSPRRRRDPADGRGQNSPLSRHSVPARLAKRAESHAPPRASGEDRGAHRCWRKTCPDLAVRSTFIVGFPGETEEDFEFLLQWLKEARINRAGCFKYEPVEGAKANAFPGAVPKK